MFDTGIFCILLAMVLVYVPAAIKGVYQARHLNGIDNLNPRDKVASLQSWGKYAHGAHQNSLETFPMFAAGVLSAKFLSGDSDWINGLSIFYVVSRAFYILIYVTSKSDTQASLRTAVFTLGLLAIVGLFIVGFCADE